MSSLIDLRSDTVTRPTPEMRRAMADAEVGDDVLGDDPTVMELQEFCADLLGKQAGLFVPSGSMGNQVSLGALTRPGDEVICEAGAHILHYEGGSVGAHLGLMTRSFPGVAGMLPSDVVADAIRPGNDHAPRTAVVAIENTHNGAGGTVFPLDEARSISKVCRERDVAVHLDGARIFNAQAATGSPVREWADCADTVTFCFSKGLGAPIGSMVCSDSDVITEAHRLRKRLGGGMRQVGVVAAAARVAIETGVERLVEDHEHARRLAEAVADLDERAVDPRAVQTNMVYIDLRPFDLDGPRVAESLLAEGVLALGAPGPMMRFVTHRDVSSDDLDAAIAALRRVLAP
ncbi:MAG: low specificity L-threonine aldolase [Actinomycetota bacterium]|nr:low specificity L-threonine aldolase [Actinomycetota bacterium]